jgi:hypothetical protein
MTTATFSESILEQVASTALLVITSLMSLTFVAMLLQ